MVGLSNPKRSILTQEDFEKYPVWTWDDEMENVQPLSESQPATEDYADLFIKARFKTSGYEFDGYLMGGYTFYGFAIFFNGEKFMFNKQLTDLSQQQLHKLFGSLKCKPFKFFPIEYASDVILKPDHKIAGVINMENTT